MKFHAISIAMRRSAWPTLPKILLIMKLTTLILIIGLLQVSAKGVSQITLNEKEAPVAKVLESIKQQSGYYFFYDESELKDKKVTVKFSNSTLDVALTECFKSLPFTYQVLEKNVVITLKEPVKSVPATVTSDTVNVHGRVVDNEGQPLPGATITVSYKKETHASIADKDGKFAFSVYKGTLLKISFIGYVAREMNATSNLGDISLQQFNATLDETQVIGYGTQSKRFSVGSATTVTAKDISDQPVTNVAQALQGRVAGLDVTSLSGVPGAQTTLQIRGQNTLGTGKPYDQPLIIVDGIPYAGQNTSVNMINTIAGQTSIINGQAPVGLSPLANINPLDIESITVLKDADATSIYGSRGSNGVILITTKKGRVGKTSVDVNARSGLNFVANPVKLLNTQQYLDLRRQALAADGVTITPNNSSQNYDLTVFDPNKYTNFYHEIYNQTASNTNIGVNLQGGSPNSTFLVSGNYSRADYNYPGSYAAQGFTLHSNLHNTSVNGKLSLDFNSDFGYNTNNSPPFSQQQAYLAPPNTPNLLDASGNPVWSYKGVSLANYQFYAFMKKTSLTDMYHIGEALHASYKIFTGLSAGVTMGYNRNNNIGQQEIPIAAQYPAYNPYNSNSFLNNTYQTIDIEPQLNYNRLIGKGAFSALLGGTYTKNLFDAASSTGQGYANAALLGTLAGATQVTTGNSFSTEKYVAAFGRLNYVYDQKYIINLTGRRDGSSNFGPGRQFGDFWSVGGGWIVSEEKPFKAIMPPLVSLFKLSGNYGTTGSNGVSPYQYLPNWSPTNSTFQTAAPYLPQNLYNPNYSWATKKELNLAADFGFFNNRLLINATYYRDREGDQLLSYPLAIQAGFSSVTQNLNAVLQNSGWEFMFTSVNIKSKDFNWISAFNTSFNRNKLISFPGLATSSYANIYVIGQSTTAIPLYTYKDVNPTTGVYEFINAQGQTTYTPNITTDRTYHDNHPLTAGLNNTFNYKRLSLTAFLYFNRSYQNNYLYNLYSFSLNDAPGSIGNQPAAILGNYWQKPGDIKPLQRLTQTYAAAYNATQYFQTSTGAYSNDTYLRLQTLNISYSLPDNVLRRLSIRNFRLYLQAQNLFTITNYKVGDPSQPGTVAVFPTQRILVCGLSFTL
jgi:TonB-linked SusC/RagA family outer membrane protein